MNEESLLRELGDLKIKGLTNFIILDSTQKGFIRAKEEANNEGIMAALARDITVCCTHDSTFREPAGPLTEKRNGELILLGVPFPEFTEFGNDVISGSPGIEADEYLRKIYKGKRIELDKEDATLLIGLN